MKTSIQLYHATVLNSVNFENVKNILLKMICSINLVNIIHILDQHVNNFCLYPFIIV